MVTGTFNLSENQQIIIQIRQQYRDGAEHHPGNIRLPLLLAIQQHLFAGVAAGGPLVARRFSALLL